MIKNLTHIRYKRFIFSVSDYFLTDQIGSNASIIYCIQTPKNHGNNLKAFYTLLIDLYLPIESIKQNIYHRTLSEINSFLNNQNFEHKVLFNLPEPELKKYMDLFDKFASKKNIRLAERFRLQAYNKAGILAVTFVRQENQFIYINFYRVTTERATNLSSFQPEEKIPLNASNIGRAHRALHWLDIIEFKTMNINYYDFGGWYDGESDKMLLNVNAFKEQFTKVKVLEYTGVIYQNPFLKLLLKWKK